MRDGVACFFLHRSQFFFELEREVVWPRSVPAERRSVAIGGRSHDVSGADFIGRGYGWGNDGCAAEDANGNPHCPEECSYDEQAQNTADYDGACGQGRCGDCEGDSGDGEEEYRAASQ